jgi:hypothetical protein
VNGVGPTPTLSWSAPATGTPTRYEVELFRLAASGSATTSTLVARFVTAGTVVHVPPGLLAAGSYCARVTARTYATDTFAAAPFRRMNVGAWAQVLSGVFTP